MTHPSSYNSPPNRYLTDTNLQDIHQKFGSPSDVPISERLVHPTSPAESIQSACSYLSQQQRKGFIGKYEKNENPSFQFKKALLNSQMTLTKQRYDKERDNMQRSIKGPNENYLDFWLSLDSIKKVKNEFLSLKFSHLTLLSHPNLSEEMIHDFLGKTAGYVREMKAKGQIDDFTHKKKQEQNRIMFEFVSEVQKIRKNMIVFRLQFNFLNYDDLSEEQKKEFPKFASSARSNIKSSACIKQSPSTFEANVSASHPIVHITQKLPSIYQFDPDNEKLMQTKQEIKAGLTTTVSAINSFIEEDQQSQKILQQNQPNQFNNSKEAIINDQKPQIRPKSSLSKINIIQNQPNQQSRKIIPPLSKLNLNNNNLNSNNLNNINNNNDNNNANNMNDINGNMISSRGRLASYQSVGSLGNMQTPILTNRRKGSRRKFSLDLGRRRSLSSLPKQSANSSCDENEDSDLDFQQASARFWYENDPLSSTRTCSADQSSDDQNNSSVLSTSNNNSNSDDVNSSNNNSDIEPCGSARDTSPFSQFEKLTAPIEYNVDSSILAFEDPFKLTSVQYGQYEQLNNNKHVINSKQLNLKKKPIINNNKTFANDINVNNDSNNNNDNNINNKENQQQQQNGIAMSNNNSSNNLNNKGERNPNCRSNEKMDNDNEGDNNGEQQIKIEKNKENDSNLFKETSQHYGIEITADYQFLNERTKEISKERYGVEIYDELDHICDMLGFSIQQKLQLVTKYSATPEMSGKLKDVLSYWKMSEVCVYKYNQEMKDLKFFVKYECGTKKKDEMQTKLRKLKTTEEAIMLAANNLKSMSDDDLIINQKTAKDFITDKRRKFDSLVFDIVNGITVY